MDAQPTAERLEALLSESAWVRALAARLTADEGEAEDLVQESWLAALRRPPNLDTPLRPWLGTVMRNAARLRGRGRANRVARERMSAPQEASVASAEEEIVLLESQELVTRKVRELPDELRTVVLLRYYEGLNSKQIGARLGVPAGTVRWRLGQALERLRDGLDETYDGDRRAWMAALLPLARLEPGSTGAGVLATLIATGITMPWTLKLGLAAMLVAALASLTLREPAALDTPQLVARGPDDGVEVLPSTSDPAPREPLESLRPSEEFDARKPVESPAPAPVAGVAETRIALRLVDQAGRPVVGARVVGEPGMDLRRSGAKALEALSPLELLGAMSGHEDVSGADGRAQLRTRLITQAGQVQLEAIGPDLSHWKETIRVEPGEDFDFGNAVLLPAGALRGRILGADGEGLRAFLRLASEELTELPENLADATPPMGDPVLWGSSEKDGSYRFDGVPEGSYRLWASPVDEEGWSWSAPQQVRLGSVSDLDLAWSAPDPDLRTLVRVLAPDGTPRPKALLRIESGDGRRMNVSVDEKGEMSVGAYLRKFTDLVLTARDAQQEFAPGELRALEFSGPMEVRLRPLATELRPLSVHDAQGRALGKFRASISVYDVLNWREARRAAKKGLELRVPSAAGLAFDLFVEADGHVPLHLEDLDASDIGEPWVVQLEAVAGIHGRVTFGGRPVRADLRISHRTEPGQVVRRMGHVGRVRWQMGHDGRTARDGSFSFPLQYAGDWVLRVRARGAADRLVDLTGFEPSKGRSDLEIALQPAAQLEGRVQEAGGNPVERVLVRASHPDHEGRTTHTDADGRYVFADMPLGEWYVSLGKSEQDGSGWSEFSVDETWEFPSNVRLQAGTTSVHDILLPSPRSLRVQGVLGAPGSLPTGLVVKAWPDRDSDPFVDQFDVTPASNSRVSAEGTFELSLPRTGAFLLGLACPDLAGSPRYALVHEASPLEVSSDLSFAKLSGRIGGERDPLAHHYVNVSWERDGWKLERGNLQLGDDLSFGPALVAAGAVRVQHVVLRGGKRQETNHDLWLEAGESRELSLP